MVLNNHVFLIGFHIEPECFFHCRVGAVVGTTPQGFFEIVLREIFHPLVILVFPAFAVGFIPVIFPLGECHQNSLTQFLELLFVIRGMAMPGVIVIQSDDPGDFPACIAFDEIDGEVIGTQTGDGFFPQ